jgi:putative SOS response-associated peptidase YedK
LRDDLNRIRSVAIFKKRSGMMAIPQEPRALMRPFPAEPMRIWPVSTRVNKPENDDPSIIERNGPFR